MTFEAFVAGMPLAGALGFRLVERTAEEVTFAMAVRGDLLQIENVVHGGILATLADSAAVFLLCADLPAERTLTSIEFKMNFLRPALLGAGEVVARARIVQRGRRVAVVDVDVMQETSLAAKGLFTYLFLERERSGTK
jgi:uncharacterized protein (TIGR00369 family)